MNDNNSLVHQTVTTIALSWALFFARMRLAVFPVHFVYEDGGCSCESASCDRKGKHPMTVHGLHDATVDEDVIRSFFTGEPDANIGIRTGIGSNLIVLDVDVKSGGPASLDALVAEHGALPITPTVTTGSGGKHYWFSHPGEGIVVSNRQNMRPGLDLRGDGGYVLAPPSNHVAGEYAFDPGRAPHEVALAPMPPWLRDLALGTLESPRPTSPAAPSADGTLGKGERHPVLFALAGAMRQKGMSRAGIEAALKAENQARCSPPLEEKEITKMVAGVMKYAPGGVPKTRFLSALPREEVVRNVIQAFETAADPRVAHHEVAWIVPGYVAEGTITLLTGRAKASGKSTLAAHMLAKVVEGQDFLGRATRRSPIVYLTEERDTFVELLKRANLLGRADFRFLRFDPARDATFAEQVAREVAKEIGAKVLVIDTLAQFLALRGDTENEAGAALEALKPLQEAAREGLAVITLHHEKKGGGEVGDGGRGSSAFAGAVDIILSLRRPEGQTAPNVRVLHALSRFPVTPPVQFLELTDTGYEAREEGGVVTAAAEKVLLENAPVTEGEALPVAELVKGTDIKDATARKAAKKLTNEGKLHETGDGVRGSPRRYWKSPPADSDSTRSP